MTPPDDLTRIKGSTDPLMRFFDELHAAADRRGAEDIFFGADWVFVRMDARERERIYEQIDDIIAEKPHPTERQMGL